MFISLDLETTGFDPEKDQIIEFGAIKFDLDGNSETLSFLINPKRDIPEIVSFITAIHEKDVEGAPEFSEKAAEIQAFIGDAPIIGHNIQFDTNFLRGKGLKIENPEYDTQVFAGILLPHMPSYSLEVISEELGLTHEEKHRALDDAIAAMELFLKECEAFRQLPAADQEQYLAIAEKSQWCGQALFKQLIAKGALNKEPITKVPKVPRVMLPTNADEILAAPNRSAFEEIPPFEDLIIDLAAKAQKNTYISLPLDQFIQTEELLPRESSRIDQPESYISRPRFEAFIAKPKLHDHEAIAALKYLNWLRRTSTGLLGEVPLYGKEKQTIEQVKIDLNSENPEESEFFLRALQKDSTSAAVCSHQYIVNSTPPAGSDLIIFNLPSFIAAIRRNLSVYLKPSIFKEILDALRELSPESLHEEIASIESSCELLFAIVTSISEANAEELNEYTQRININLAIRDSSAWQKALFAARGIIDKSKVFGEIKNSQSHPILQKWKKILGQMHQFFLEENPNQLKWFELWPDKSVLIRSIPTDTKALLEGKFSQFISVKIVDENLQLCNDLPADFTITDLSTPAENLTVEAQECHDPLTFLEEQCQKNQSIAIVCSAKKQLQTYTLHLHSKGFEVLSQLTGSRSKLLRKFQKAEKQKILLLTPPTWIDFNLHDQIDLLIIDKIPFDPPNNPELIAQSQNRVNPFIEVQLPRAIAKLKKILNRLRGSKPAKAIIIDNRLKTSSYGKDIMRELEKIGKTKDDGR